MQVSAFFTIRKIIVYQQKKSTKGFISICPSLWATLPITMGKVVHSYG